jgi:hypothetical protein
MEKKTAVKVAKRTWGSRSTISGRIAQRSQKKEETGQKGVASRVVL